jgi:molybdate transport system substrate-binding protein
MIPKAAATLLGAALAGVVGCSTAAHPNLVTVLGAASLAGALDELVDVYTSSGTPPSFAVSTGSSAALRIQIEQGAPADLFLSADTTNAQALADAGLADGPPIAFAMNRLTIIVPRGNPAAIESPRDLGRANVRIVAAGEDVPITRYAEQAIANLGSLPGYPADFSAAYESNIVSREDNVGAVTSKIALGEGDAAIVYVTDAAAAEVDSLTIPVEANVEAIYAGVLLKAAYNAPGARAFFEWLRGPDGQQILERHGFSPAP